MRDELLVIKGPLQYLDGEVNAVRRDFESAGARIALAFPDLYELGMSHQGLKILYEIVNARPGFLAERVFAPWLDREEQLRREGAPLAALESGRPLGHFDVVGFTLPYELTYTNILTMLDLAQLPLLARDRDERHPLIAGGGPGAFNPEPLADFFDFFLLGDGEEAILDIMDAVRAARAAGDDREAQLARLAGIAGVYVPRYYRAEHAAAGRFAALVPLRDAAPARVAKRILADLDAAPYPVRPAVPFVETTHDRITIEIARGCIQRCRFCQAGVTYRPYRERSARQVLEMADAGLASTGYDELSLASLSCGDHRRIEELIAELMHRYERRRVSISLPSLRPGTITEGILNEIAKVKRTGFTIAPEAGTQRLRDVISKGITEEVILETCRRLFARGWSSVKLYFMIGLPTETEADRDGIPALVEKIRRVGREVTGRKPAITAAVSSFVPKPHTPFQWAAQVLPNDLRSMHARLREQLHRAGATFKWHHPDVSALEGLLARGDRRLGRVILLAWQKGRRFDGWTEQFALAPWLEACGEAGVDFEGVVARERANDEPLPWDHLGYPEQTAFLREELERALRAEPSPACAAPDGCPGCGVCQTLPLHRDEPAAPAQPAPPQPPAVGERLRLEFAKFGALRYLSHLGLARAVQRLFRRAEVPLAFSQGHSPHPKIQFGPPLPLGYDGDAEYLDFETAAPVDPAALLGRLAATAPQGLEMKRLIRVAPRGRSLFDLVGLQVYRVVLPKERLAGPDPGGRLVERLLRAGELPAKRERDGVVKTRDVRPLVHTAEVIGESEEQVELRLELRRIGDASARPDEVLRAAGEFPAGEEFWWRITRTANLVAGDNDTWHTPTSLPEDTPTRSRPAYYER
jgi:radical SAM family uncharacterized protein/radical SAM-linked protein